MNSGFQFQKAASPFNGDVCLLGDKSTAHHTMLLRALAASKQLDVIKDRFQLNFKLDVNRM